MPETEKTLIAHRRRSIPMNHGRLAVTRFGKLRAVSFVPSCSVLRE